jgi:hypothetical protein
MLIMFNVTGTFPEDSLLNDIIIKVHFAPDTVRISIPGRDNAHFRVTVLCGLFVFEMYYNRGMRCVTSHREAEGSCNINGMQQF